MLELLPADDGPETFGEIFRIRIGVTPQPPKFLAPYFCDVGRIGFNAGRWSCCAGIDVAMFPELSMAVSRELFKSSTSLPTSAAVDSRRIKFRSASERLNMIGLLPPRRMSFTWIVAAAIKQ